jgi:hypothetical protein
MNPVFCHLYNLKLPDFGEVGHSVRERERMEPAAIGQQERIDAPPFYYFEQRQSASAWAGRSTPPSHVAKAIVPDDRTGQRC